MKVLFLVPYPLNVAPSQRFRFEQYLLELEKEGIDYKVRSFLTPRLYQVIYQRGNSLRKVAWFLWRLVARFWHSLEALRYDVIFLHREMLPFGPPFLENLLHIAGKRIIFDFDDAIYLMDVSESNRRWQWLKYPRKTDAIISWSQWVLAGNRTLADYVRQFHSRVEVFPTTIDTKIYRTKTALSQEPVCIGWSGSRTTIKHLRLLESPLSALARSHPIRLGVIGVDAFSLDGVPATSHPWSFESELDRLLEFDIGIMPLPDDAWGKGKCGLKALQYMALGIPTVCSPVGVNKEIIEDGVNGFLASTEGEWVDKLSLLIKDSELRRRLGEAGRKTVEMRYASHTYAPRFVAVLKTVQGSV